MQQDYENGKYTVIFNERTGALHALYNGEVWEDMSGNNLLYWMLVEHKRALEQRAELLEALKEAQKTMETIDDRLMGLEYAEARYFARQGASSSKSAITKAEAAE